MRFVRFLAFVVIAAGQAGCVGVPFPGLATVTAAPPPPPPADLDSILYARPAAVLAPEPAALPVPAGGYRPGERALVLILLASISSCAS